MIYKYGIIRWDVHMPATYYDPAGFEGRKFNETQNEGEEVYAPNAVFYASAEQRDLALKELANRFVGYSFAPIEVTSTVRVAPGDMCVSSVSDKGVLPK